MSKSTKLVRTCRTIEDAIDRTTRSGSGSYKTRVTMRRELALWITTCYSTSSYERLPRLRLPWDRWDQELYLPAFRLAATIRLLGTERISKAQALKLTGAAKSDLDYALKLLADVGLTPWVVAREQSPDIGAALAAHRERLHVHLEARALEDMLLAVAEGYKVGPGKGIRYTEVYGLCFGSVRRSTPRHESHELRVNVSRIATQIRAKATASEVTPNAKSLAAHLDVATNFFPYLEVVGDYHSHPYRSFGSLSQARGWEYSQADESSLEHFIDEVMTLHNRPCFSLIVAVAEGGKVGRPARKKSNVVQITVGSLYFVVSVYRIRMDAQYDEKVTLILPGSIQ